MPESSRLLATVSARPDGASSVAAAIAASLARRSRTLLVDLNPDRAELATLLDIDESRTIYHLAYASQLAPVSGEELEAQVAWREGLALLPGITEPSQVGQLQPALVRDLIQTAGRRFDRVVLDLGRASADRMALLPALGAGADPARPDRVRAGLAAAGR